MLKKILFSFLLLSFVFILSACVKKAEAPSELNNNQLSPEKLDDVNNQRASLTPEEEKALEEEADKQEVIDNKWISSNEVAKHNNKSDCWLIINDRVYDMTKYIAYHPGGPAILAGCGKDATEMFFSRPNDGTAHSEKAQGMLDQYYIGDRNMKE